MIIHQTIGSYISGFVTGDVQFDVLYTYLYLNRGFYMTIRFIKREQVKNENPVYYNVEVVI